MDDNKYTNINFSEDKINKTEFAPHDLNAVISSGNRIDDVNNNIDQRNNIDGKIIISHKNDSKVICEEKYSKNVNGEFILEERQFYNNKGEKTYCETFDYINKSNPRWHEQHHSMIKDTDGNIIGYRFYKKAQNGKSKMSP